MVYGQARQARQARVGPDHHPVAVRGPWRYLASAPGTKPWQLCCGRTAVRIGEARRAGRGALVEQTRWLVQSNVACADADSSQLCLGNPATCNQHSPPSLSAVADASVPGSSTKSVCSASRGCNFTAELI